LLFTYSFLSRCLNPDSLDLQDTQDKSAPTIRQLLSSFSGIEHGFGHARAFLEARQELAVAQTTCRASKNALP
jgi:hypothetical protein